MQNEDELYQLDPLNPDNANRFSHIVDESTSIPAPTSTNSVYLLAFGPIDMNFPHELNIYSSPLNRVHTQLQYAYNEYSIDNANGLIYLNPVNYARTFKIAFTYAKGMGAARTLVNFQQVLNLGADSNMIDLKALTRDSDFQGIVAGTDVLQRKFDKLDYDKATADTVPWSSVDPYQYKILDENIGQNRV